MNGPKKAQTVICHDFLNIVSPGQHLEGKTFPENQKSLTLHPKIYVNHPLSPTIYVFVLLKL